MTDKSMYPSSLRKLNQWVLWGHPYEKDKKMPCCPSSGQRAKVNDSQTWDSFETAYSQGRAFSSLGLGFVLVSGIVCIDLDHCFKDGELTPESKAIVTLFNGTYMEKSQSGEGVHIFVKGHIPKVMKKTGVEMYETARYIAMTGDRLEGYSGDDLTEYQEGIDCLYNQYADVKIDTVNESTPFSELRKRAEPHPDEWILERLMKSDKTKALFQDGDLSAYDNDQSRADLALVEKIAYWSEADPETIDRLFRQSALFRSKWDERRGAMTYGQMTIQKACNGIQRTYSQDREMKMLSDFSEMEETEEVFFQSGRVTRKGIENALERIKPFEDGGELQEAVDDIHVSALFARIFKGVICFCPEYVKDSWFVYSRGVWRQDLQNTIVDGFAKLFALSLEHYCTGAGREKYNTDATRKYNAKLTVKPKRDLIVKDARELLTVESKIFDSNVDLLNCKNCVIDLKSGEILEHSPRYRFMKQANVSYNPKASCPRWEQFLVEVFGDEDKIRYLQLLFGYTMTGKTEHEFFHVCWGATTRNGKSTLLETVNYLLGNYSASIEPETLREKERGANATSEDLAHMDGRRFVLCSEPPDGMVLNASRLKGLTGGDMVSMRRLYQAQSEFKPQFKLFINTNYLPTVNDPTIFASDRARVIKFERHFEEGERDIHLKDTLRTEESLSGILNWCLEGLRLYYEQGEKLEMPEIIKQDSEFYKDKNDKIGLFLKDCTEKKEGGYIRGVDAYSRYVVWCQTSNMRAMGKQRFFSDLRDARQIMVTDGGRINGIHEKNVILGYSLLTDFDLFPQEEEG